MANILRVITAFSVLSDPTGHVYAPGELVDAGNPYVKGRESHFETVEAHVSSRASSRVEAATAAPGERRGLSTAPKPPEARKKAAAKKAAASSGEKL